MANKRKTPDEIAQAEALGLPYDSGVKADTRFQKGNKVGAAGRPKGARSTLGQDFIKALQEDFRNGNGLEAIQRVREKRPQDYLKVLASILPKQVEVTVDRYEEMSEEDLERLCTGLLKAIDARIETGTRPSGVNTRSETAPQSTSVLPSVH